MLELSTLDVALELALEDDADEGLKLLTPAADGDLLTLEMELCDGKLELPVGVNDDELHDSGRGLLHELDVLSGVSNRGLWGPESTAHTGG